MLAAICHLLVIPGRCLSTCSRSAKINSVFIISTSLSGSMVHSTCTTSAS
ncbi:MAG: hypothetical protein WCG25_01530 [bacterium]